CVAMRRGVAPLGVLCMTQPDTGFVYSPTPGHKPEGWASRTSTLTSELLIKHLRQRPEPRAGSAGTSETHRRWVEFRRKSVVQTPSPSNKPPSGHLFSVPSQNLFPVFPQLDWNAKSIFDASE